MLITDATGAKAREETFLPFGLSAAEDVALPAVAEDAKGFIGERYDSDAGLQYLNARYYDPELGLFLQPDWFEVTQAGVGTNRYSYSFNDPVNRMDPSGNQAESDADRRWSLLDFFGFGAVARGETAAINEGLRQAGSSNPDIAAVDLARQSAIQQSANEARDAAPVALATSLAPAAASQSRGVFARLLASWRTKPLLRPSNSGNYSIVYEMQLPTTAYPGISRQRHNQIANQNLHEAFESDPSFAQEMEKVYPGIVAAVRPGPRGAFARTPPTADLTWHHGQNAGQMELVPLDQHTAPGAVQGSLHPNGVGGYAIWGRE